MEAIISLYHSPLKFSLLVLLLHYIADFNIQIGATLHTLKSRDWWIDEITRKFPHDERMPQINKYQYDHFVALCIHSLVWSIVTFSPVLLLPSIGDFPAFVIVLANTIFHTVVDDLKANWYIINLVEDQSLHLLQIALTLVYIYNFI